MTEVEFGVYTHRWSPLQVRLIESIARHTRDHQYAIHVTQRRGNCHQNLNRIWRRLSAPYVVLLDEDVEILQDGWLKGLIDALEMDPKLGVVGCQSIRVLQPPPEPGTPFLAYRMWVPAYVMAFKRERVADFLRFDEAIPGQMGMTDLDACAQILDKGLRVAENPRVIVYHPARDDDETRRKEDRPLIADQERWYPEQVAYMRQKWGDLYTRMTGG